jgi:integrase/recombinase XerD
MGAQAEAGEIAQRPLSIDAEEFLSFLAVEKGRAINSLAAYRRDLLAYERYLAGREIALAAVKPPDVDGYLRFLGETGHRPSSTRRALAAIRGLHRFLLDERGAQSDPTEDTATPRSPTGVPRPLSEPEVMSLLASVIGNSAREQRDRAILELLYGTGMRISELAGVSLSDLDPEAGLVVVLGKGSKERIVPVGSHALRATTSWIGAGRREWRRARPAPTRSDDESLLLSQRGRRMSRQAIWAVVHLYGTRQGLGKRLTPHVLRHSCATHMLDHGADIRIVQEMLGHASITTTQLYTKVSQEHLRRVYEASHPRALAIRGTTRAIDLQAK